MSVIILILLLFAPCFQQENCDTLWNVRLTGTRYAGVLEICHLFVWLSVCGDSWSNTSAGVVCRQLNFNNPSYQSKQSSRYIHLVEHCCHLEINVVVVISFIDHVGCGHKCFGRNLRSNFTIQIDCHRNFSHLRNCGVSSLTFARASSCQASAGVFCGEWSMEHCKKVQVYASL